MRLETPATVLLAVFTTHRADSDITFGIFIFEKIEYFITNYNFIIPELLI